MLPCNRLNAGRRNLMLTPLPSRQAGDGQKGTARFPAIPGAFLVFRYFSATIEKFGYADPARSAIRRRDGNIIPTV
jgi:hypothetical protein